MPNKYRHWGKEPLFIFVALVQALEIGHQEGGLKRTIQNLFSE